MRLMKLVRLARNELRKTVSNVGFYGEILAHEGARSFLATVRVTWALRRTSEAYMAVDREEEMHNENMTYLRVRLDKCRKDLFKAQHELRMLRENRA